MGTQHLPKKAVRDWRTMAIRTNSRRDQDDAIVNVKTTLLLKLAKEWLFYFVVYSVMTGVVNLSLTYSLVQQNWTLTKTSFNETVSFVRHALLNYRRFAKNYFYKLSLILNSTNPAELENLRFSMSNDQD